MGDDRQKISVMSAHKYMDEGFKIVTLKFPAQIKPTIGMSLKDIDNVCYTISGIVFDRISDRIWDCKLKDGLDKLIIGSELYIVE